MGDEFYEGFGFWEAWELEDGEPFALINRRPFNWNGIRRDSLRDSSKHNGIWDLGLGFEKFIRN